MTAPLFNATLVLNHFEPTQGGKKKILRLWRITFKRFLMISQRTPSSLVNEIMNRDLTLITTHNAQVSQKKWEARKNYQRYKPHAKEEEEGNEEDKNHQWAIQLEEYPTISVYSLKPHLDHVSSTQIW